MVHLDEARRPTTSSHSWRLLRGSTSRPGVMGLVEDDIGAAFRWGGGRVLVWLSDGEVAGCCYVQGNCKLILNNS